MTLNKEKIAAWSFPIFIGAVIIIAGIFFAIKWGYGIYSRSEDNKLHTHVLNGYSIQYPCKKLSKSSSNPMQGCEHNEIAYSSYRTSKSDNYAIDKEECKKVKVGDSTPNENTYYERTYNGYAAHICVHVGHSERGVNTAYRNVDASISTDNSTYRFSISGPTAYHDVYSSYMETLLSTFKELTD